MGPVVETRTSLDAQVRAFMDRIRDVNPRANTDLIERAFRFSWEAHLNQFRKSGEPFLAHPAAVAMILAEQNMDSATIAAGILHDVVEDTAVSLQDLAERFNDEITRLVDGVTKIRQLQIKTRREQQAESYRKMLLSMARDIRVIIIKFADRLHNLRTLKFLEPDKIRMIAQETLDIYAPLAHRLGMAKIKWELEDLAFKYLHAEEYNDIVAKIVATHHDRERLIDSFALPLRYALEQDGIKATVVGRPKHFYSLYRKIVERNKPFEEIYDLLAIRIITESVRDCYHALGIVHSRWKPLQDRFKDYISMPKTNGYQSLHTTIVGDSGNIVEIQIRTWEMNQIAEEGIAAHWLYKDGSENGPSKVDQALTWLRNLIDWQKDLTDSAEFYEFFKIDLFHSEIFVFTPKGDLISLPKGATALDLAFAIHTELGLHCIGAKVDGKFESISNELKSGCTVEILHSASKKPSLDWLRQVKTPKARSAIRRWLKNTGRQESIDLGKSIITTAYKRLGKKHESFMDQVPRLLQHLGINSLERLYELVGNGELPVVRVIHFFNPPRLQKSAPPSVVSRFVNTITGRDRGVLIGGHSNLMIRFAKCCTPIPGDAIIGFITRGRGISVHRADCPNMTHLHDDRERKIEVSWDTGDASTYIGRIELIAEDRTGLLHDITSAFANFGVNVLEGSINTVNRQVHNRFKVEIRNRNQLRMLIRRLQRIKGIERISRIGEDGKYIPAATEVDGT